MRNDSYKLVINKYQSYDAPSNACAATQSTEFYEINEAPVPKLDKEGTDLLSSGKPLTPIQKANYNALTVRLNELRASQPACPGDVNIDGVVNQEDLDQWSVFNLLSDGFSSWADINQDGMTNGEDLTLIQQNQGPCPK